MRLFLRFIGLMAVLAVSSLMLTMTCFAADAASAAQMPGWFDTAAGMISQITFLHLGASFLIVCKWSGAIGGVMTALSVFVAALSKAFQGLLTLHGLDSAAGAIEAVTAKVMPYLQWLSIYNVQKSQTAVASAPAPATPAAASNPPAGT